MLNVHDAYAHPNFFSGIDEMTGFKTRYISLKMMSENTFLCNPAFVYISSSWFLFREGYQLNMLCSC